MLVDTPWHRDVPLPFELVQSWLSPALIFDKAKNWKPTMWFLPHELVINQVGVLGSRMEFLTRLDFVDEFVSVQVQTIQPVKLYEEIFCQSVDMISYLYTVMPDLAHGK